VAFVFKGQHPFIVAHSTFDEPLRIKTSAGPAFVAASAILGLSDELSRQYPGAPLNQFFTIEPLEK
jgi:hypothetical protein